MGFFSKSTSQKKIDLICDIGSGSVAAALVEFDEHNSPRVLITERVVLSEERTQEPDHMYTVVESSLRKAMDVVALYTSQNQLTLHGAHCFYSSPWFLSYTHVLKHAFDKSTEVTPVILKQLLAEGEALLDRDTKATTFPAGSDRSFVEKRVTRMKLNGYETHKPFGKKATSVEVSMYAGIVSQKTISMIEGCIGRVFHFHSLQHHTFSLANFSVLKSMYPGYINFVIVDVSGEVTDISLVSDGNLVENVSFPIGKRDIVRVVADACKLEYGLALSALTLASKGEANLETDPALDSALESAQKLWNVSFKEALDVILTSLTPALFYVISDQDMSSFFGSALEKDELCHMLLAEQKCDIISVEASMFDAYVARQSTTSKDKYIDVESLYVGGLYSAHTLTTNNYTIE